MKTAQMSKAEQLAQRVKELEDQLHNFKVAHNYLMGACRSARLELIEAGSFRATLASDRVTKAIETAGSLTDGIK